MYSSVQRYVKLGAVQNKLVCFICSDVVCYTTFSVERFKNVEAMRQ